MKKIRYAVGIFFVLMALYLVGNKPETPIYSVGFPAVNQDKRALSDSIDKTEANNLAIKINNEARIVWTDSVKSKTKYSIVYLPGFTASQMEGDPVHRHIAAKYGMNLYLARLSDYGLASDSALVNLTPDRLWESSKKALAIGQVIGDKVILMSTSTGSTLALKLAAIFPEKVEALINYSPNVKINNRFAPLMNNHWGLSILNLVNKTGYVDNSARSDSLVTQYWTIIYKTEALMQLQELLETTMVESVFNKVKCSSLTMAYYKDEEHQDPTAKVSAMRWMHASLGTDARYKKFIEMPTVGVHPMASSLRSKDIKAVELETEIFLKEVLGINSKD